MHDMEHAELFFHVYAQKSLFKVENVNVFFGPHPPDHHHTLSTDIELIHRKNTASSRKEPTLRLSQVVKDAIRKQLL